MILLDLVIFRGSMAMSLKDKKKCIPIAIWMKFIKIPILKKYQNSKEV